MTASGVGAFSRPQPLRFPDTTSRSFMTRRAWWLLVVGFVLPGSAQVLAGNRRLGRVGLASTLSLWSLSLVLGLLYLLDPTIVFTLATVDVTMLLAQVLLVGYAVLWAVLTLDTLRLVRLVRVAPRGRRMMAVATVLALVVGVGAPGYSAYLIGVSRGLFSGVFGGGGFAQPVDGHYNVLLLGGDAGADREGMRPDSISVASIDARTGQAVVIGLPRNMQEIPFPEDSPMHDLYPDGYNFDNCEVDVCLLNSIYTEVEQRDDGAELYPDAEEKGSSPGIEAMRDAVEGITGLTIQYFGLIDMQGFTELIDALGGIDITWAGDYPLPLGGTMVDGELTGVNIWLEPGSYHFTGERALAYARSRYGDTDYDRMARQRSVQAAILAQFSPANVLSKFEDVARAGTQVVKTDIPRLMLGHFVDLAMKTKELPLASLELVPPLTEPGNPDYDAIREAIADELAKDDPAG